MGDNPAVGFLSNVGRAAVGMSSLTKWEGVRTRRLIRSRQVCACRARRRLAMQILLSVEQLSVCLHKSVASIRSDASRNPQALPPICRLPGTKRLLWRADDVETWLAKHVLSPLPQIAPEVPTGARKRGRPRKTEQPEISQSVSRAPLPGRSGTLRR